MLGTSFALALATLALSGPRLGDATRAQLATGQRVLAVVAFEVPALLPRNSAAREAAIGSVQADLLAACGSHCGLYRAFHGVAGLAVWVDNDGAEALLSDPRVLRIDRDVGGHGALAEAVPVSNFQPAYDLGLTGEGVPVVVLDSGIDSDHPDFAGVVTGESCFCRSGGAGCCPDGSTFQNGPGSAEDDAGHGTGVTAMIASQAAAAAPGGAPGVEVFAVKVLDENQAFDSLADIVAAMDALGELGAPFAVINMSLGTDAAFVGVCDEQFAPAAILVDAVDNVRAAGTLVVASSGNQALTDSIQLPSCLSNVIAVGATAALDLNFEDFGVCQQVLDAGQIACFSNSNDQVDIVAPGAAIHTSGLGGGTVDRFGTSFAAPLVAACIALMREAEPDAPVEDLEAALFASPTQVTDDRNGLSFPVLDCGDAIVRVRDPDDDGVPDIDDNCLETPNADQVDADGDGEGDACDICPNAVIDPAQGDPDGDAVCFDVDNCPDEANDDQLDGDADDMGDACDPCPADPDNDVDGDGVCGEADLCPADPDPDQADEDQDGVGDACDACPMDPLEGAATGGECAGPPGQDGDGGCGCGGARDRSSLLWLFVVAAAPVLRFARTMD